jgi:hypothetical protein
MGNQDQGVVANVLYIVEDGLMTYLLEQTLEQLQTWFTEHGLPAYRARQVRKLDIQKTSGIVRRDDRSPSGFALATDR